MKNNYLVLNLRLFEGEGSGDAGSAASGVSTADAGQSGRNPQDAAATETKVTKTAEERSNEFESLIKGEYKDIFDSRVQKIVQGRLKESKGAEDQLKNLQPVLDLLSSKYGVDATDAKALISAVESDNAYWEEEAANTGMSIEQVKELHRMRAENERFRRAEREAERQRGIQEIQTRWAQESEAAKQIYPGFDFATEAQNNDFTDLLKAGVDVKTAYEVIHKDEIIHSAMQYTAAEVKQKTVNSIQAQGRRPAENGVSSQGAAVTKKDVNSLTRKDREDLERRAMRGEKISF